MLIFSLIAQRAALKPIQPHKMLHNRCHGRVITRNRMKFQQSLSLFNFQRLYGSRERCEASLEKARLPDGFIKSALSWK
jgi:hypothetical protein